MTYPIPAHRRAADPVRPAFSTVDGRIVPDTEEAKAAADKAGAAAAPVTPARTADPSSQPEGEPEAGARPRVR